MNLTDLVERFPNGGIIMEDGKVMAWMPAEGEPIDLGQLPKWEGKAQSTVEVGAINNVTFQTSKPERVLKSITVDCLAKELS